MDREKWVAGVAGALLILYCFPVWLAGLAALFGQLRGDTVFGQVFLGAIAGHSSDPIQLVQRFLLPVVTGGTVALMWSYAKGKLAKALIVFTVATLALTVFLWVFLNIANVALDLWQPADDPRIDSGEKYDAAVSTYVSAMVEGLAAYLLALLGLSVRKDGPQ
jgi:hypothetical protein